MTRMIACILAATVLAAGEAEPSDAAADAAEELKAREEAARGSHLETDSAIDHLLSEAAGHFTAGRWREGAAIVQHLLDDAGSALSTADHRLYRPAHTRAEALLAGLPAEGLAVYRLSADGEAAGLRGAGGRWHEPSLRAVVRRFFFSALGDDAAFDLACLHLDRGEWPSARRLLARIIERHPDPSLPPAALHGRLALACARSGDAAAAAVHERALPPGEVRTRLAGALAAPAPAARGGALTLPGLPAGAVDPWPATAHPQRLLVPAWTGQFPLLGPGAEDARQKAKPPDRQALVMQWQQNGVQASRALVAGDQVLLRSHDALRCHDLASGALRWELKDQAPPAPPATAKDDANAQQTALMNAHLAGRNQSDIQGLLSDRVGRCLSVAGDGAWQIEDYRRTATDAWAGRMRFGAGMVMMNAKVGEAPAQAKPLTGSALAAVDLRTGKRLWRVGRTADEQSPFHGVRFLAAAVPCGADLVITAWDAGGEIFVAGLAAADGALRWKTYLGTRPGSAYRGMAPQNDVPVALAVDGSELVVSPGNGLVYLLDGGDGRMQWAARYARSVPTADNADGQPMIRQRAWAGTLTARGWHDAAVIRHDGRIIVLPSDSQAVLAFTGDGAPAWRLDLDGAPVALGVADGALFATCGTDCLRIDLARGKQAWRTPVGKTGGIGAATADAVYVPVGRDLRVLDPRSGKQVASLAAALPDQDPVGNLALGGGRLVVAGLERIAVLDDSEHLLADLGRRLAASDDPGLRLQRGRLLHLAQRWADAATDLRVAQAVGGEPARLALLDALLAGAASGALPGDVLVEADRLAQSGDERARVALARAQAAARDARWAEAAAAYIVLAGAGGAPLPADADGLAPAPASLAIAALATLVREHPTELGPVADAAFASETSPAAVARLARAMPGTDAAARAVLAAGARQVAAGEVALAEILLGGLARSPRAEHAAAGHLALARLAAGRDWPRRAAAAWNRLAVHGPLVPAGETRSAAELADAATAARGAAPGRVLPALPWRQAWSVASTDVQVLGGLDDLDWADRHVLTTTRTGRKVSALAIADGKPLWQIESAPPKEAAAGQAHAHLQAQGGIAFGWSSSWGGNIASIVRDGHLAVWREGIRTIAVDLTSGRQLWSRAFGEDGGSRASMWYGSRGDGFNQLSLGGGVVAEVLPGGSVRALDAIDGAILWERGTRANQGQTVLALPGVVLIQATQQQEVLVCAAEDGRVLARMPGTGARALATPAGLVALTADAAGMALALWELPAAKRRWTRKVDGSVSAMHAVGDDRVLTVGYTGDVALLRLDDGEPLWTWAGKEQPGRGGMQSGVAGDTVWCLSQEVVDPKNRRADTRLRLTVLDLATGAVRRQSRLGPNGSIYAPVTVLGDPLAEVALINVPETREQSGRRFPTSNSRLQFWRPDADKPEPQSPSGLRRNDGVIENLRPPALVVGGGLLLVDKHGLLVLETGQAASDENVKKREKGSK